MNRRWKKDGWRSSNVLEERETVSRERERERERFSRRTERENYRAESCNADRRSSSRPPVSLSLSLSFLSTSFFFLARSPTRRLPVCFLYSFYFLPLPSKPSPLFLIQRISHLHLLLLPDRRHPLSSTRN